MPAPQFISRATRHRMVLKPSLPYTDALGITRHDKSQTVEFIRGSFTATDLEAKKLGFSSASELANAIRQRLTDLDEMGQTREVWEKGAEPGRQHPSSEEMFERITDASVRRDAKKLRALRDLEMVEQDGQGGHQRVDVLAGIDRALAILTDGKEGRLGPGRPHPVKPETE